MKLTAKKFIWIGPVIFIFIGYLTAESIELGVGYIFASGLAGLIFHLAVRYLVNFVFKKKLNFFQSEEPFMSIILILAAEITKIDGQVLPSEIALVEKQLQLNFEKEKADSYFNFFNEALKRNNDINKACSVIDYEFNDPAKSHLIYLLAGIATADGILSDSEIGLLRAIVKKANIRPAFLINAFNLYSYQRESYKGESRSQQSTVNSKNQLNSAYELIGVPINASEMEIKKAYRQLAKMHHPDRVTHLGPSFQKSANQKFQQIAEAYDQIKTDRGFN